MPKRHGCLQAYLLYMVLFVVYFFVVGKMSAVLFPGLESETALMVVLGGSALLSILTVSIYRKVRSKTSGLKTGGPKTGGTKTDGSETGGTKGARKG